jgi:hypothetical protein
MNDNTARCPTEFSGTDDTASIVHPTPKLDLWGCAEEVIVESLGPVQL